MASPDGYLVFQTAIDESGFNDGAERINKSAEEAAGGVDALASALVAAGIAGKAQEISDALYDCAESAATFETSIAKVMTIADASKTSAEGMKSAILELSNSMGADANELAESTYQAISASVDTADAVNVVGEATKLATGGFTDTATAIDILTTAMNAYGLGTDQVSRLSDVLVTTQNLGKTSVGEVASAMGKVIPLAAAYGVEIENLSSAYAVLTANGIKTDEATTYIKAALNELGDSSSTVGKILVNQTGKGFSELTQEGESLGDVLQIIGDSVGGNAAEFNNLWSSAEAGVGMLSIFNSGAEHFNSVLGQMQNSTGATEAAFAKMTDTTEYAKQKFANALGNMKIAIGDELTPALKEIYNAGANAFEWASEFVKEHPEVVKAITVLTAALTAMTACAAGAAALKAAIAALNGALLANPCVLLATAVAGVTAAFAALAVTTGKADTESSKMFEEAKSLSAEAKELKDSVEQSAQAMDDATDSTQAQYEAYRNMADKAYELNDAIKEGSIADDEAAAKKAQLAYYVKQLNDQMPGLNLELDEQTGLIKQSKEATDEYIASLENKALAEAISGEMAELWKAEAEAKINAAEAAGQYAAAEEAKDDAMKKAQAALAAYTDMQNLYNTGMYDGVQYMEKDYAEALEKIAQKHGVTAEEMADGANAMERATVECANYNETMNRAAKAEEDATEASTDARKAIDEKSQSLAKLMLKAGYSREKIAELTGVVLEEAQSEMNAAETTEEAAEMQENALESLQKKYTEFREQLEQDIQNKISLFDGFDGGDDISVEQMLENLQKQREGLENWKANMATLANEVGTTITPEFYNAILEMGPEAANAVQHMVSTLDQSNGRELLAQMAQEWGAAMDFSGPTAESMSNTGKAVETGLTGVMNIARKAGVVMPETLASGIINGTADIDAATNQLGNVLSGGMEHLVQMAADAGVQVPPEISAGLEAGGAEAVAAMQSLVALIQGETVEMARVGEEGGKTLDSGAADSIKENSAEVTDAASDVGREAGKAGQEGTADGIKSNSGTLQGAVKDAMQGAEDTALGYYDNFYTVGQNLMKGTVAGLTAESPAVEKAAREAVRKAVEGAKDEGNIASPSKVFKKEVGVWLSKGMAEGIRDGIGDVEQSSRNMADASLNAAKDELDIHSPSGVFQKEVGKQIVNGIRKGIAGQKAKLIGEMKELSESALKAAQAADGDYSDVGSSIMDNISDALQKRQELAARKGEAIVEKYINKVSSTGTVKKYEKLAADKEEEAARLSKKASEYNKKGGDANKEKAKQLEKQAGLLEKEAERLEKKAEKYKEKFSEFGSSLMDALNEGISAEFGRIQEELDAQITEISNKYQTLYDDVKSQRDEMFSKMTSPVNFYDLDTQLEEVERYQDGLDKLKGRIPDTLMDEILGMGLNDAVSFSSYLNSLTDAELEAYKEKWEDLRSKSERFSDDFFSDQFADIKAGYEKEIADATADAETQMKNAGKNIIKGLIKGLRNEKETLSAECKKIANSMIKKFKKTLGINSPSKVMEKQVGKFLPPGIAEGFDKALPDAERRLTTGVEQAIASLQSRVAALQYIPAAPYQIFSAVPQVTVANSQPVQVQAEIHTTVDLDGRTVGRALTPYVNQNLGYRQTREERGS